jgi:hypothetical protein
LRAYKLVITYKLFTSLPNQQYSIDVTSVSYSPLSSNTTTHFPLSSSPLGYPICPSSNTPLYAHINTITVSHVGIVNTLTFSSTVSPILLS